MSSRVIVSVRVRAPPETAFEVFVDEIGLWWRSSPLFRFTGRDDGELRFEGDPPGRLVERYPDGESFEVGAVRTYDPPRRLRFGWRQESFREGEDTEVEVVFEPFGSETRVSVEHRGFETLLPAHKARHGFPEPVFLKRISEPWRRGLDRLGVVAGASPSRELGEGSGAPGEGV